MLRDLWNNMVITMNRKQTEAATSRTIRIGAVSIGLIGLDRALNEAAARAMPVPEAARYLFRKIQEQNYIPPGKRDQYLQALEREYRQHLEGAGRTDDTLVIRIFGTGCISCNGLQNLLIQVLDRMEIGADIEQIHDPDEIGRAGILQTPALMINGVVKSAGLLPTPAMVEQWLEEAVETTGTES